MPVERPIAIYPDYLRNPEAANKHDRTVYPYRPQLLDAQTAHHEGHIIHHPNGCIDLKHTNITGDETITIPPTHQFLDLIRVTYTDLHETVTGAVQVGRASPKLPPGNSLNANTLIEFVEREYSRYFQELITAQNHGLNEADVGTYVFDPLTHELFLFAPEEVHRLALITSHTLFDDPQNRSVYEIWQLLRNKTVPFAGASIGGNLADGYMRATSGTIRLADFDHTSIGNLLRMTRADASFSIHPRSVKEDPNNPFEIHRPNKAAMVARSLHRVNPYLNIQIFLEGVTPNNIGEFLRDADLLFEEIDRIALKVSLIRISARSHGIDTMMVSDIHNTVAVEYHPYSQGPQTQLLNDVADEQLATQMQQAETGGASDMWDLAELLMGPEFRQGPTGKFIDGNGEHATSSLPQPGHTALGAAYVGATMAEKLFLGHDIPSRLYVRVQ